jgi:hypothetical protein
MGRRSRKRTLADAPPARETPRPERDPVPAPSTPRLRARLEDAPKAPWHPFPLVELAVLAGMALVVAGIVVGGDARPILLFGGLALVSVAALELAIREHFAGYRSHSALLAAVFALGVAVPLWYTPAPQEVIVIAALLAGAAAFRSLRGVFERKSGGLTWRA